MTGIVIKILSEVLDVKKQVREGSLMILDSLKAYPDLGVSISPFAKRLLDRAPSLERWVRFICLIIIFRGPIEYEYELSLPSKLADIRMKGFCLYHEKDFDQRFTQN